jgi:hypothetical protein
MAYRMKAPLLIVKDQAGRLHHHYNQGVGGSIGHGAIIGWLNPEQRAHFLRLGLVEQIPDEVREAPYPAAEPPSPPVLPALVVKPKQVASKDAWVEFGVSKGNDRTELEAMTKQELVDLLNDF